ncbi:MAG: carboxypeptidase regulatory-like domain-containing protein [Saprospiraceae bacterium]|nr:carboxypeptidase regulatory-like domain-containing protein [Pyrinomonadaceae bacterium]
MKKLRDGLFKVVLSVLALCLLIVIVLRFSEQGTVAGPQGETGRLEKMIVANGSVAMDIDLNRLDGTNSRSRKSTLRFTAAPETFFTILAFNDELRGSLPSSMGLIAQDPGFVSATLKASYSQLVIESMPSGGDYELVVRDAKTGFVYFNIEGQEFDYKAEGRVFSVRNGRLLISKEFAAELGRPSETGSGVGEISITATMRPIEITQLVEGEVISDVMPALGNAEAGGVPGPDVVVGDLIGLAQFGSSSGTQVGLAVGTDSCNFGTVDLNWFALPLNDHPVIPQNLYRMSGGASNNERFEQIGQSSVKHAFTALTQNLCGLGCNGVGGSRLGSGCSDPYSAGLNAGPALGSRAWINPFNGSYPRGDSPTPPNNHNGHAHTGPSHRILTETSDLNSSLNAGATYYAEAQYITPHEYAWCQANPTQCNMYNNVSYRRYNVTGTTCAPGSSGCYSFVPAASTVRAKRAVDAWTGATVVEIKPDSGNDGVGAVAYKVTNPSPGVWHYEYAVYNENLDRAIQSLGIPIGAGVTLSNVGFRSPPQHPGWSSDGTLGNAGFSSAPWTQTQAAGALTWTSETFAQNQNANAIRWGTMYNFRFDSNRPPQTANATIGFFKTGAPITVQVQGPSALSTNVSVSGRITTSAGQGVANARVSITDSTGNIRAAITGPFGYYRFDNVATGGTYTVGVQSKRYTFTPRTLLVNDNLTDVDFVAGT